MRMIVYALSAACGCAPAGYSYYRNYYPVAEPAVIEYRSTSEWGGETALPIGYSYSSYTSPYYVGAPYPTYNYPYVMSARPHHAKRVAAKRPRPSESKLAQIRTPIPKPRPRFAAKVPPHTKVIVE
jgi:hypothetical protein